MSTEAEVVKAALRAPFEIACWGCGKWSSTLYCAECAGERRCQHDQELGDCPQCDFEADLAYDAFREKR